mmetsp:Transcript_32581/g.78913  ORF Transcript_32581/g.78913 Transcript_32581/m.78913 type:complete len:204 (-) Transcript_32581:616-1227(-)
MAGDNYSVNTTTSRDISIPAFETGARISHPDVNYKPSQHPRAAAPPPSSTCASTSRGIAPRTRSRGTPASRARCASTASTIRFRFHRLRRRRCRRRRRRRRPLPVRCPPSRAIRRRPKEEEEGVSIRLPRRPRLRSRRPMLRLQHQETGPCQRGTHPTIPRPRASIRSCRPVLHLRRLLHLPSSCHPRRVRQILPRRSATATG